MPSTTIQISPTLITEMNNLREFAQEELSIRNIKLENQSSNDNELFATDPSVQPGDDQYYVNSLKAIYNMAVITNRLAGIVNGIGNNWTLVIKKSMLESAGNQLEQYGMMLGFDGSLTYVHGDQGETRNLISMVLDSADKINNSKKEGMSELEYGIPDWLETSYLMPDKFKNPRNKLSEYTKHIRDSLELQKNLQILIEYNVEISGNKNANIIYQYIKHSDETIKECEELLKTQPDNKDEKVKEIENKLDVLNKILQDGENHIRKLNIELESVKSIKRLANGKPVIFGVYKKDPAIIKDIIEDKVIDSLSKLALDSTNKIKKTQEDLGKRIKQLNKESSTKTGKEEIGTDNEKYNKNVKNYSSSNNLREEIESLRKSLSRNEKKFRKNESKANDDLSTIFMDKVDDDDLKTSNLLVDAVKDKSQCLDWLLKSIEKLDETVYQNDLDTIANEYKSDSWRMVINSVIRNLEKSRKSGVFKYFYNKNDIILFLNNEIEKNNQKFDERRLKSITINNQISIQEKQRKRRIKIDKIKNEINRKTLEKKFRKISEDLTSGYYNKTKELFRDMNDEFLKKEHEGFKKEIQDNINNLNDYKNVILEEMNVDNQDDSKKKISEIEQLIVSVGLAYQSVFELYEYLVTDRTNDRNIKIELYGEISKYINPNKEEKSESGSIEKSEKASFFRGFSIFQSNKPLDITKRTVGVKPKLSYEEAKAIKSFVDLYDQSTRNEKFDLVINLNKLSESFGSNEAKLAIKNIADLMMEKIQQSIQASYENKNTK